MQWIGENSLTSDPTASELRGDTVNYYLANCYDCDSLPVYSRLIYNDIYPDIDLHIYSNSSWLKLYFVVNPGGNPRNIELNFSGQDDLRVDSLGVNLKYDIQGHVLNIPNASVYQLDGGNQIDTLGWLNSYTKSSPTSVTLGLGDYDLSKRLIYMISEPINSFGSGAIKNLIWSTFIQTGSKLYDISTNGYGEPYVCGTTTNANFPIVNAYQGTKAGVKMQYL